MRNHQENGNRYQFRLHPTPPITATTATSIQPTATASSLVPTETSTLSTMATTASVAATTTATAPVLEQTVQQQKQTITNKIEEQQQQQNSSNNNTNTQNCHNTNKQQQQQQQHCNNNNNTNNNNNIDNPNKTTTKCTTTASVVLKDSNSNVAAANILHRKQFIPISDTCNASFSSASVSGSIQDDISNSDQCGLTQAGLEEYNIRASSYYDQPVLFHHQKQSSYAQSEGYHSYVSSSDSSSATPFLDRLRQESELLSRQSSHHWSSQNDLSSISCNSVAPSPIPLLLTTIGRDINGGISGIVGGGGGGGGGMVSSSSSVIGGVPTANNHQHQQHNNSSESISSTETLKWLGSMSDVSEASHATGYSAISESVSSSQLIVHSSRVLTPKRHHSESVLYLNDEQQHSPNALQQQLQISPTLRETLEHSPTTMARPIPNHRHSPSYPPVHTSLTVHPYQQHQPQQHVVMPPTTAKREVSVADLQNSSLVEATAESSFISSSSAAKPTATVAAATAPTSVTSADLQSKSSISVTILNSEAVVTISPQPPPPIIAAKPAHSVSNSDLSPSPNVAGSSVIAIGINADSINAASTTSALSIATSGAAAIDNNTTPTMPVVETSPLAAALNAASYRSNHRLFPVSTYTEPVHSNTSQYVHHPKPQYSAGLQKPAVPQQQQPPQVLNVTPAAVAPTQQLPISGQAKYVPSQASPQQQQSWQSVAELINDFERSTDQQPQKYAYIEPSKTHRISNPALKAFQKNAVQSYFERQQHQQQHSKEHSQPQKIYQPHPPHHHLQHQQQQQQQQQQQLLRPHSYQSLASNKETGHQLLRNSLPNAYGAAVTCQQQQQQQHHHQQQLLNSSMRSMHAAQIPSPPQKPEDNSVHAFAVADSLPMKPASPAPPPPPPRSRSLMPTLLRRSSSASDYGEFRDQYTCAASQEKLQAQSIKNISSSEKMSFNDCGMPPPPPPPRGRVSVLPPRRTSSASEYAAAMRDKALLQQAAALAHQQHHPHQHSNHQPPLPRNNSTHPHYYTTANAAPITAPPLPTNDAGWVPERPPKNPNLRVPSPDLPPPPADVDTNLSDEPLPPPPPEILHRQQQHYYDGVSNMSIAGGEVLPPKAPSPNRRNSFAGSSTRKSFFSRSAASVTSETPSKVPPMIPKKPTNIELLHLPRPPSSLAAHHSNKAHKVILNGGMQSHMHQHLQSSPPPPVPQSSTKANANRKRPHHPAVISVPPIMENPAIVSIKATTIAANPPAMSLSKSSPPPPPLMPRSSAVATINSKQRCNSKASYLPRQSLEKLNNSDPDHGSYKLMLTSNEDLVGNTKTSSYDILAHSNGKIPNNLPDVLPLGAKLQPQPASPTSANGSPLRYGSNNNLANTMNSSSIQHQHQQQQQHQASTCYSMYPMQHRYSTPAMHSTYNNNNSNNPHVPNYTRSQSFDVHASNNNNAAAGASSTKFMSQSTIDLKKTHHLEPTLEETMCETTAKILSPAQSENNLSSNAGSPTRRITAIKPLSPCSAKREFHRLDSAEEQRHDTAGEGRIFRAELVSTTLATSPCGAANNNHKSITRKDSLRENIEKITQLQSKLMSAHLSDSSSLISVYGSKPSLCSPISTPMAHSAPTEETNFVNEQSDTNSAELKQQQQLQSGSSSEDQQCSQTSPKIMSNDLSSLPPYTTTTSLPQQQSTNEYEQSTTIFTDDVDNDNAEIIATQIPQMDSTMDGLKLVQRSELILRVNPNTVEVASQTDDLPDCDMGHLTAATPQHNKEDSQTRYSTTTLQPRQRHPIEVDCDNMFKELASLLSPNDKLIEILTPTIIKSPTDYISNLYNSNVPLRPAKRDVGTSTLMRMHRGGDIRESPERGGNKMMTVELQYAEVEVLLTNGNESDGCDVMKKKVDELIKHLNRKIRILNKEQTMISEECAFNDELGSNLISKLTDKVRPIEATKFRTYIDDIGHITSLLLSLSERLARSENSLSIITDNSAEKKTLESKRDRLLEQLDEAKRLKEDIDRRGSSVIVMLVKNLSAEEFADFDYFINMKAKLIADARDIADKIKCGEEQLNSLSEALIQSDC